MPYWYHVVTSSIHGGLLSQSCHSDSAAAKPAPKLLITNYQMMWVSHCMAVMAFSLCSWAEQIKL